MSNALWNEAKSLLPWLVETRRTFHQCAELSMQEYETTERIAKQLDEWGVPYERFDDVTGLVAKLEGRRPGKTIALRSDIDALPIQETNPVDYVSKNAGCMHACGHDTHLTMNLGAIRLLQQRTDEWAGTIYFLFQPGEEIGQGARALIARGDWFEKTDAFFGVHIWSDLPVGEISVRPGPCMAYTDRFRIVVRGRSGHGAHPEETVDPIVAAGALIGHLQTLVSREFSAFDPLIVTVGQIHSGSAFNVIPGEAFLEGTVRYYSPEIAARIASVVERMAKHTAAAFRAEAEVEYTFIAPGVINDEAMASLAQARVRELFGEQALKILPPSTGGEDFSEYLQTGKPGVFCFIGGKNEAKVPARPHHNEQFNIDEDALAFGAALYADYAMAWLRQEEERE